MLTSTNVLPFMLLVAGEQARLLACPVTDSASDIRDRIEELATGGDYRIGELNVGEYQLDPTVALEPPPMPAGPPPMVSCAFTKARVRSLWLVRRSGEPAALFLTSPDVDPWNDLGLSNAEITSVGPGAYEISAVSFAYRSNALWVDPHGQKSISSEPFAQPPSAAVRTSS